MHVGTVSQHLDAYTGSKRGGQTLLGELSTGNGLTGLSQQQ